MRLNELMNEAKPHVPVYVAHDPKEAEAQFLKANKGKAGSEHDARAALKRVRNRYDVEIVGDLEDYMGHPGKKNSDKKNSLLANRKKKS